MIEKVLLCGLCVSTSSFPLALPVMSGEEESTVLLMAVKDVRNGDSSPIHCNILRSVTLLLQALSSYDHVPEQDFHVEPCTIIFGGQGGLRSEASYTREYLKLSAGFAGDARGRRKQCSFFMAVKNLHNEWVLCSVLRQDGQGLST